MWLLTHIRYESVQSLSERSYRLRFSSSHLKENPFSPCSTTPATSPPAIEGEELNPRRISRVLICFTKPGEWGLTGVSRAPGQAEWKTGCNWRIDLAPLNGMQRVAIMFNISIVRDPPQTKTVQILDDVPIVG